MCAFAIGCAALPGAPLPATGWELIKMENTATTSQEHGRYLLSLTCQRGNDHLDFHLSDQTLAGEALQGIKAVMIRIGAPGGRAHKWSIETFGEGPGIGGRSAVSAQTPGFFRDTESLEAEDIRGRRVLFRPGMKGTGAARIAFAGRCGICPRLRPASIRVIIASRLQRRDVALCPLVMESGHEIVQPAGRDGIAHALHKLLEIMQVMPGQQHAGNHFPGAKDMMQIGARIAGAGGTGAFLVQRARVVGMAGILDIDLPVPGPGLPRPPRA